MLVELVQLKRHYNGSYNVAKILINPQHIVLIQEDEDMKQRLHEGKITSNLSDQAEFSRIMIKGLGIEKSITVIGSPEIIEAKIFAKSKKQVLRG
tara:strand:+ start:202 stop:486 length:285 start_codon:yes stop_codon:yes gene_type:complete